MSVDPACLHLRYATIGSNANVFDRNGKPCVRDMEWCVDCGAIRARGESNCGEWMPPGGAFAVGAYERGKRLREDFHG